MTSHCVTQLKNSYCVLFYLYTGLYLKWIFEPEGDQNELKLIH